MSVLARMCLYCVYLDKTLNLLDHGIIPLQFYGGCMQLSEIFGVEAALISTFPFQALNPFSKHLFSGLC